MSDLLKDATARPWEYFQDEWGLDEIWTVESEDTFRERISEDIQGNDPEANARLIVTAVNAYEPMLAALRACRAWHYAEEKSLGDFYARCDLAAYSEHLTKIALGMESEFSAPPQMIVWPTVELNRTEASTLSGWVDQLIEREAIALAKLEGEKP